MKSDVSTVDSGGALTIGIEERLLFACARPSLDGNWQAVVRTLVGQCPDWSRVIAGSDHNFVTLLLLRHLRSSCAEQVPRTVLQALAARQMLITARALEILRLQRQIVNDVLSPLRCGYAFVKGATLSQQIYGMPSLRQYRDLDILIDAEKMSSVGAELISRGFRIKNKSWPDFLSGNLAAYCRCVSALELASPSGIIVELHRRLDNSGCVFNSRKLLAESVQLKLAQDTFQVLPPATLFVYLCFHHSRHHWERLHWCADIAAFRSFLGGDLVDVRRVARRLGLSRTVDEAWKLGRDLDELACTGAVSDGNECSRFLPDMLRAVRLSVGRGEGFDSEQDTHLRIEPDFPYPWQKSLAYRARFFASRVHPSENDHNALPVLSDMHWLYYFTKPLRVAAKLVFSPKRSS